MKKLVSVLLLLALAATVLVGSALAAETDPNLSIGEKTDASAGEEVTLTVKISGVAVTGGKVFFDLPDQLSYVKTESKSCIVAEGNGGFGFMCVSEMTELVFDVVFKVASDAAANTYPINVKLDKSEAKNVSDNAWTGSYNVTAGAITVKAAPHEHSYTSVVTAPTCTEQGYTTYTCACGDSYVGDYVAATGHSWDDGEVTTAPTCTEKGVKTFTCTNGCGATKTEDIVATGHSWDDGEVTTAPTCGEKGVKTFKCKNGCGETKTEEIAATGLHSWGDWVNCDDDPDCDHKGCHERTCSVCFATQDEDHDYKWSEWVKSEDGKTESRTGKCSVCDATKTETRDVEEDTPVKPDDNKKDDTKKAPKTGDESNLIVWAVITLGAGAGLVYISKKRREN